MMGSCTSSPEVVVISNETDPPEKSVKSGQNDKQDDGILIKANTPWRNLGYEVYKGLMGEELFKKKVEDFEKPFPPPGLFAQGRIAYDTTKLKLLFGAKVLVKGQRATHSVGVGSEGIATIVSNPQFPACEFFTPGASYPVCLRHSTIKSVDDVLIDFCGGALRFAGSDEMDSPCDLIMGTGPTTPLWSSQAIFDAARANITKDLKTYLLLGPDHLKANIGGLRQKPESFYDQRYYTEVIFDFKTFDEVKRYVRFRLLPADGRPETGLLSEEVQWHPWINERSPDETLPMDYLKREYRERISKGPLDYKLQLQFHEPKEDDPPTILQVGREWDEESHPWLDVADIKMTSLLSPMATERLKYIYKNLPASIGILPAVSVDDPNVVVQIRNEVYVWSHKLRENRSNKLVPEHMTSYLIRVETGSHSGAGTDASISITLTGTKGKTDFIKLDNWGNDFERGDVDEYSVEAIDVGEVLMVHLHNDRGGWWYKNPDWFVNKIAVISSTQDDPFEFPCYRWVLSDLVVFEGRASLPFQELPDVVKHQRIFELKNRQEHYKWGNEEVYHGLPGYLHAATHADIPRDSQFSDEARSTIKEDIKKAILKLGLGHLMTLLDSWDNFDDFEKILQNLNRVRLKIVEDDRWMTDEVFGSLFLNGVNPNMIQRCEEFPSNFHVTEEMVKSCMDRGKTLEEEMKAGHVYIVDYKVLEGIPTREGTYLAQPLGLFYVNTSGDLVPIAIQFLQQPSDTNPIWTPSDSQYDWLLAKMWLRHADTLVQQVNTHLLETHLVMEPFAVAVWRQLPSIHPVFQLLFPHLRSVMAINNFLRTGFVAENKRAQEILKKGFKAFKFGMLSLPDTLKERGVDDPEKLPKFYFRDDALRLWSAITTFVKEVIILYYTSDDDVSKDSELQAWIKDAHDNGFQEGEGGDDHGCPNSLETREQLIHVLTCLVFTCSCQHAAVNFGLLDVAGFVPISPSVMRQPPPTKKNETTLKSIMDALPSKSEAAQQVALGYVFTQFAEDERYIGDMTHSLLTGDEEDAAMTRFQVALQEISDSIKARNEALELPYIFLLPERVPNSIGV
ncbi:allene oxide synthase-lipoxygenase protein-like [Stylophora pistillata]|uniref:allene oxide synthase-lipoxygenase protein-like n=1 Tax=Stylophora pistillata TaxID=50429 RepID=UPI000C03E6C4|nr:allene oxide synthase-lipoxygenase protein-like [Stylophora pistillata]XP_022800954.1 allene oxide synthase-lipoxygenase protein-like [Stylophora pistillata]